MPDDRGDEVRRLRAEVYRLRDDNAALQERLTYAWQEVERLRTRLLEGKRVLQAAEPRDPEHDDRRAALVSATSAELDVVRARLRHVRPLSRDLHRAPVSLDRPAGHRSDPL
jgi:hypothetical protein